MSHAHTVQQALMVSSLRERRVVKLRRRRPGTDITTILQGKIMPDESRFRHIAPNLRIALRQYAIGIPLDHIEAQLGLSTSEIELAARENQDYIDFVVGSVINPAEIFQPMLRQAALAYHEALAKGDPQTRTSAATRVFEWLIGKPVVRQITDVRQRVTVQFVDRAEPE